MIYKKILPYVLIYIGTVFYTLAAYYHLSYKPWTFEKAITTALPLVCIEYVFSLNGNHRAHEELDLNPIQILVITITFYFINLWLLNYFIIKKTINIKREVVAFALIITGFLLSENIKLPH